MTDRELLEMAAKAVGMVILQRPWSSDDGWFFCESHGKPALHFRCAKNPHTYTKPWMPLNDEGDALRLGCDLGLFENAAYHIAHVRIGDYKEMCRAIVVTAAEIGVKMP